MTSGISAEATQEQRMIDERLAAIAGGEIQLLGSRCDHCGTVTFPQQNSCPRCTRDGTERHELARAGTLWSWTIQGFPPKSPPYGGSADGFEPYGVGYVELGGEVRVEGILTTADPDQLAIGMTMHVVALPAAGHEHDGLLTFGFAPGAGST
jgi:uncharacterized protein